LLQVAFDQRAAAEAAAVTAAGSALGAMHGGSSQPGVGMPRQQVSLIQCKTHASTYKA
jgi:hypothetical protein